MWSVESDTEKLVRGLLSESSPSVPPRTQKIGAAEVSWWEGKPGDAVVMASGGSAEDRTLAEQVVAAQLEGCGYKRARFTFDAADLSPWIDDKECYDIAEGIERKHGYPREVGFYLTKGADRNHFDPQTWKDHAWNVGPEGFIHDVTHGQFDPSVPYYQGANDGRYYSYSDMPDSQKDEINAYYEGRTSSIKEAGWPDIMEKAKRLIQSGNVTILRNGWNNIIGHVIGDHGEYNTEIGRDDPESRTITTWQCECPWDQYAWQRTRQWKKYEGRPCSHVMALYWKALSTPLDDYDPNQHGPMTPGQKGGPPAPSGPPLPTGQGMPKGLKPEAPKQPEIPGMPTPSPIETQGPQELAPPSPSGALPTPPLDQLSEMQPPIPGATPGGMPANPNVVSVPGAKVPTPFNPIQFPGGTYSSAPEDPPNYREGSDKKHCGNCKMNFEGRCWGYGNKEIESDHVCDSWYTDAKESKVAHEEFVAPEIVRLKEDCYGMAEGKSEEHGAGQYRLVPAGTSGEVLGQDPTTGWVEVIFPIEDSGPLEPYHIKCFVDPTDLVHSGQQPPGPFIKRRR